MSPLTLQNFRSQYQKCSCPCERTFDKLPQLYHFLKIRPPTEIHRDVFFRISREVLEDTILSHEACSRLRQLASTYRDETEKAFQAISVAECIESVEGNLRELKTAHETFSRAYTNEFLKFNQAEEARAQCPNTCHLFLKAFFNDYSYLSSSIQEDPQFWIRLPTLAIELLLRDGERHASEVFRSQGDRIYKMSRSYRDLWPKQKEKLHQKLLGQEVELSPCTQELFKSIYLCQEKLSLEALRAPQHFLNREAEKAANLFQHVARPQASKVAAAQAIALWYLKNPNVKLKDLPTPYQAEAAARELRRMKEGKHEEGLDAVSNQLAENPELSPWLESLLSAEASYSNRFIICTSKRANSFPNVR